MHQKKPRFMTCGDDGTARLWDLKDRTCIRAVKLGIEGSQTVPLPACGKVLQVQNGSPKIEKVTATETGDGGENTEEKEEKKTEKNQRESQPCCWSKSNH